MTIQVFTRRGQMRSITGADVGDVIMFMASDPKNAMLPKKVKLHHPYTIVSVDAQGWTRFMKTPKKTCISGCEPNQVGRYIIVARNAQ